MKTVYLNDKRITMSVQNLIGEGGESEVYRLDSSTAIKLFKTPDHAQYRQNTPENLRLREAARMKLKECQTKLLRFPHGAAPRVVEPQQLIFNKLGVDKRIAGYSMSLITGAHTLRDYAQRDFRESSGIGVEQVIEIFKDLNETVKRLHDKDVTIGDFNQFNTLVTKNFAFLIDADSMQFGPYFCTTYSPRYADPRILKVQNGSIEMVAPHSRETDWYAFAILLFECMQYVHPYGGVYKPGNQNDRISLDHRPMARISVFHPDVKYPAFAEPLSNLSDEVLAFYHDLLIEDRRTEFPNSLLYAGHFTGKISFVSSRPPAGQVLTSSSVGLVNQKGVAVLPPPAPAKTLSPLVVLETNGVILRVQHEGDRLRYLYHEDGKFMRENGRAVLTGNLDPSFKFSIHNDATLVGKGSRSFILRDQGDLKPLKAELYRGKEPVFDANNTHYFLVEDGQLNVCQNENCKLVDEVLSEQTKIWVGPKFGFGFYMAGHFRRAFLFDAHTQGRTLLDIEPLMGKIIEVTCRFSEERLWLMVTTEIDGKNGLPELINRSTVFDRTGTTIASIEEPDGTGRWMDSMHDSCAAVLPSKTGGQLEALLVATEYGVIRVDIVANKIVETTLLPGTDSLIQAGDHLVYSNSNLYAWSSNSIRLIATY